MANAECQESLGSEHSKNGNEDHPTNKTAKHQLEKCTMGVAACKDLRIPCLGDGVKRKRAWEVVSKIVFVIVIASFTPL